jgi:hypothetical protein
MRAQEDQMSGYHYSFALAEIDYRQDTFRRHAQAYRLSRKARRAVRSSRPLGAGRTIAVQPAPARTGTSTQPATQGAGSVEHPVASAAV